MAYFSNEVDNVMEQLSTDKKVGLSTEQVNERVNQYGPNKLQEKKKKSTLVKFFEQFKDVMIIILLLAIEVINVFKNESFAKRSLLK